MKSLALLVAYELCLQCRAQESIESTADAPRLSPYFSGRYTNSSTYGTYSVSPPQAISSDGVLFSSTVVTTGPNTQPILPSALENLPTFSPTGLPTSYGYSAAATPYPTGGSSQLYNQTSPKWNVSAPATTANPCSPCVVNAQAGLQWWFPNLIYNNLASISTSRGGGFDNNSYSIVSATTTFDVKQSMQNGFYTWVATEYFDTAQNQTMTSYDISASPLPAAALTVYTTQHDVLPAPTGLINATQLAQLYPSSVIEPSIAVPQATGSAFTATSSDNVVYYTSYEVEVPTATVDSKGVPTCATSTATYSLSNPYVYTYADPMQTLGSQLAASGPVYPDFLNFIPQSTCNPGTWLAPEPTMLVVIEETYQRGFAILIAHHEVTVTDAPSAPTPGPAGQANNDNGSPVSSNPPPTAFAQNQVPPAPVGDGKPTPSSNWANSRPSGGYDGGCKGACPITIGSQAYTPNAATQYWLAPGQTLTPGGTAVLNGAQISLRPDAAAVFVNGQIQQIAAAPIITPAPAVVIINGRTQSLTPTLIPPTIQVAGTVYTELPGASFIVAGNTLRPGQVITIAGSTVSLPAGADYIAVNGHMTSLLAESRPAFVLGTSTYTAVGSEPSNVYIVAGQTLAPGGPAITISGTTLSIPALPKATGAGAGTAMMTNAPVLAINGQTYTAAGGTAFVIGGQTLTPGGVIVDRGTTISLGPSATALVVNGATTALFPATKTGADGSTNAVSNNIASTPTNGVGNSGANIKQSAASATSLPTAMALTVAALTVLLACWH